MRITIFHIITMYLFWSTPIVQQHRQNTLYQVHRLISITKQNCCTNANDLALLNTVRFLSCFWWRDIHNGGTSQHTEEAWSTGLKLWLELVPVKWSQSFGGWCSQHRWFRDGNVATKRTYCFDNNEFGKLWLPWCVHVRAVLIISAIIVLLTSVHADKMYAYKNETIMR